ncbi:hypothetical protein Lal_00024618 [Lupinus albus]|nr:hypothetical protein Lal_00024618 [Lupinus albus]
MGRLFVLHLEGKIYSCKHCRTHLALSEDIVSKRVSLSAIVRLLLSNHKVMSSNPKIMFAGLSTPDMGKLISSVRCKLSLNFSTLSLCDYTKKTETNFLSCVNVSMGEKEDRQMMTGMHTVVDIFCVGCGSIVGWKYESAHEKSQKYKEGKSVLERFKLSGPDGSNYWVNSHDSHIGGSDADDV